VLPSAGAELRDDVGRVQLPVRRVALYHLQIVEAVVGPIVIAMMDDLVRLKRTPKRLRHDVTMLQHVAVRVGHRLASADMHLHVAGIDSPASTFPLLAIGAAVVCRIVGAVTVAVAEIVRLALRGRKAHGRPAVVARHCVQRFWLVAAPRMATLSRAKAARPVGGFTQKVCAAVFARGENARDWAHNHYFTSLASIGASSMMGAFTR
jgi:hypothetical protein